jgi:hypothetical protein
VNVSPIADLKHYWFLMIPDNNEYIFLGLELVTLDLRPQNTKYFSSIDMEILLALLSLRFSSYRQLKP